MRILVLGGTVFLGRHVVADALARGHAVTLFNRGKSGPGLFPEAEHVRGDRDGDLDALRGREWDAVIDPSGYVPRVVRASSELLRDAVGHYLFVSSISVYGTFPEPGMTEGAPVEALPEGGTEDVDAHYGALKAACEREVDAAFPGRALQVRAGLIVGPYDPTERFTYWVARIAEGGEVLAPEPADQPVQLVDARDLAAWCLDAVEAGRTGTVNATGAPTTMRALLEELREALPGDAWLRWVEEAELLAAGVEPWEELPLWLAPSAHPDLRGFLAVDASRAAIPARPLAQTARDTLAWVRERPGPPVGTRAATPAGISRGRERELLALSARTR